MKRLSGFFLAILFSIRDEIPAACPDATEEQIQQNLEFNNDPERRGYRLQIGGCEKVEKIF